MADNNQPKHEGKLNGIQFMPGVSVVVGGKWTALQYWDRGKHLESPQPGHRIFAKELNNGSVRITTENGWSRIVEPWAIAWRLYEPEGKR